MIASLRVHVMEGTDVGSDASSSFKPSPYAVVVVDGLNRATTHAKHNTSNPFWAQEFFFEYLLPPGGVLFCLTSNCAAQTFRTTPQT